MANAQEPLYNPAVFETGRWEEPLGHWEACRIEALVRAIPNGVARIVDVGCGDGRLTQVLAERGYDVMGVDPSPTALARLRVPHKRGSAEALDFPDNSFDVAICTEVLEHLPDAIMIGALSELQRVARFYVLITVPYCEDLAQLMVKCPACGTVFHAYGHLRSFSQADVEGLMPECDLIDHVNKPSRIYDPRLLWFRQRVLRRYAYADHCVCPRCCHDDFSAHSGDLLRRLMGGVNLLFTRGRTRPGGWVLGRFRVG
ncbi:MAG: class I SAM-dependent methyltransferase [Nitrospira sp.]|nr:class I SAM-dependent methyltransferase [Nitrospira sp.]